MRGRARRADTALAWHASHAAGAWHEAQIAGSVVAVCGHEPPTWIRWISAPDMTVDPSDVKLPSGVAILGE